MSFPNYPNPARRARILQAHELRLQGLTLRQIGEIMSCAPSTVAGYLRDFELFRTDLMRELAADQLVSHLVHLPDIDDPHRNQRLAEMRELRLLLASLTAIRREDEERTGDLNRGGVKVDQYGNRYPVPDRLYPPTSEEQQRAQQPPDGAIAGRPNPDVPLAFIPETVPETVPNRTEPNSPAQDPTQDHRPPASADAQQPPALPAPQEEMPEVLPPLDALDMLDTGAEGRSLGAATESTRTESNKPEQHAAPNPEQDDTSADLDQNSLPSSVQRELDDLEQQLESVLIDRDWLNDYPQNNPWHPQRQHALRLIERKEALLAQTTP